MPEINKTLAIIAMLEFYLHEMKEAVMYVENEKAIKRAKNVKFHADQLASSFGYGLRVRKD